MFKRSTAIPTGAGVLMVTAALVLGSCSLGGGRGTPSKPVRVESREAALTRAERVQDHVHELTGLERNLWINVTRYDRCPGRGMGIADEGEAYQLSAGILLKATVDQRREVLRALRDKLAGEGFKITSNEFGAATGDFTAAHEPDPYTISLMGETDADPDVGVAVTVTLPCQAPPTSAASPAQTATG
ncbi:hypothetical protein [Yinghuangia seranimata]|uniref:hypothetical protein n=1 Tax=Yinghuangia seranimata TaxID=408067 RepID=UPI00248CCEC8|nr:hypothetical protein [Yinghuangia seranimata]MDI2127135.1 hypothetical protein [Yinghuangia seranimata]